MSGEGEYAATIEEARPPLIESRRSSCLSPSQLFSPRDTWCLGVCWSPSPQIAHMQEHTHAHAHTETARACIQLGAHESMNSPCACMSKHTLGRLWNSLQAAHFPSEIASAKSDCRGVLSNRIVFKCYSLSLFLFFFFTVGWVSASVFSYSCVISGWKVGSLWSWTARMFM